LGPKEKDPAIGWNIKVRCCDSVRPENRNRNTALIAMVCALRLPQSADDEADGRRNEKCRYRLFLPRSIDRTFDVAGDFLNLMSCISGRFARGIEALPGLAFQVFGSAGRAVRR